MKQNGSASFAIIVLVIIVLFAAAVYVFIGSERLMPKDSNNVVPTLRTDQYDQFIPHPFPQMDFPSPGTEKKWTFRKNENGASTIIFSDENPLLDGWNEWIFYARKGEGGNRELVGYNMRNGSTLLLHKPNEADISFIKVLGDTLYFGDGAYLSPGGVYYMNLPPDPKNEKSILTTKMYPGFQIIKGNNWITAGFGDSCAGSADYYLLNTSTKTLGPKTTFGISCGEGEGLAGIDDKQEFISYVSKRHNDNDIDGYVTEIKAASINNPAMKRTIFNTNQLSDQIRSVHFLEGQNALLLTGKKAYVFLLTEEKIDKTIALPELKENSFYYVTYEQKDKNKLCLYSTESKYLELNLSSGTTGEPGDCSQSKSEEVYKDELLGRVEKVVATIKLFNGYTLGLE